MLYLELCYNMTMRSSHFQLKTENLWPNLYAPGCAPLLAHDYEDIESPGKHRIYFNAATDNALKSNSDFERPQLRISYREKAGRAILLGMMTTTEHRGHHLGEDMTKYFINNVSNATGNGFHSTGILHKPLIALTMGRVGLIPMDRDFIVQLLPVSKDRKPYAPPDVAVMHDNVLDRSRIIRTNTNNTAFYNIPPKSEIPYILPFANLGPTVALHTKYYNPHTAL